MRAAASARTSGVLPVPPTTILPTTITGTRIAELASTPARYNRRRNATAPRKNNDAGHSAAVNGVSSGRYQSAIRRSENVIRRSRPRLNHAGASSSGSSVPLSTQSRWIPASAGMSHLFPIANRCALRSRRNASLRRRLSGEGDVDEPRLARGFHHMNDGLVRRIGVGVDDDHGLLGIAR